MKETVQKISRLIWDYSETCKTQVVQNIIQAARQNEVKLTNEDLQKLIHIVNSSVEQIGLQSSSAFEMQVERQIGSLIDRQSSKKGK